MHDHNPHTDPDPDPDTDTDDTIPHTIPQIDHTDDTIPHTDHTDHTNHTVPHIDAHADRRQDHNFAGSANDPHDHRTECWTDHHSEGSVSLLCTGPAARLERRVTATYPRAGPVRPGNGARHAHHQCRGLHWNSFNRNGLRRNGFNSRHDHRYRNIFSGNGSGC
jgi:hypothetical protein